MLNIANLEPKHFARILSGEKRTERRWRRKVDGRLEKVTAGEPIILREIGSYRIIRATVRHVIRFDYEGGCLYSIRLADVDMEYEVGVKKIQGWLRKAIG